MNSRAAHFLSLSLLILLFVFVGKGQLYLNVDRSVAGIMSNIFVSAVALSACGLVVKFATNLSRFKSAVTFRDSLSNSLSITWVLILDFYGFIITRFNWPYNPERTHPDFYENAIFMFFLGSGLQFVAWVSWVVFVIRLLVGKQNITRSTND